jgi:hypothetical protein
MGGEEKGGWLGREYKRKDRHSENKGRDLLDFGKELADSRSSNH